jgi:hypothetical protein
VAQPNFPHGGLGWGEVEGLGGGKKLDWLVGRGAGSWSAVFRDRILSLRGRGTSTGKVKLIRLMESNQNGIMNGFESLEKYMNMYITVELIYIYIIKLVENRHKQ